VDAASSPASPGGVPVQPAQSEVPGPDLYAAEWGLQSRDGPGSVLPVEHLARGCDTGCGRGRPGIQRIRTASAATAATARAERHAPNARPRRSCLVRGSEHVQYHLRVIICSGSEFVQVLTKMQIVLFDELIDLINCILLFFFCYWM
jgi:hypothetical protein